VDTAITPAVVTRAQGWALALASVASFMVVLDLQVVATALPTIRRDLGASIGQLEWTVNAYALAFAVLLMTAAAVGDRFGRRRVFAVGLGVFAAGSAACALAPGAGVLIAARTVQGAGAAIVMPLALALLNAAVPPQRRGWAMGMFGSVSALGVVVGPVLGGAITQAISWPWIFWLNVPIGLAAIPLALRRLDESYGPRAALDLPGAALGTGAALGLVWGLVRGTSAGWASPEVAGALAAGAVLAVAFTGWELRARAPMLPMRLFAIRGFSAGNAVAFLLTASITGAVFFMAQFQQVGLGQDPVGAGLRLLPWGVAPFLIAPRAGRLADRIGERPLVVSGLLLQAAGFAWIAVIAAPGMAYPAMLAPMVISGAGLGLALPAVTKAAVGSVPPADIGKASGGFSMMRQLGGAFGVAILAAVFASAGGYTSAAAFSAGFTPAIAAATGLALAGAVAGLALRAPARATAGG
jgi:EmrB/QacA subfamily drug resistance transporter